MAMLSPVAKVGNAIILATIWRRTFPRTTFHILLSGIALSDLCTGLIAQPCYAASILISPTKHSNILLLLLLLLLLPSCIPKYRK